MNGIGILGTVIVGIVAGWIAERILNRHHGIFTNLIVGLIGAFLGGWLAGLAGIQFAGMVGSLIVSTVGAVLLLAVLGIFRRK